MQDSIQICEGGAQDDGPNREVNTTPALCSSLLDIPGIGVKNERKLKAAGIQNAEDLWHNFRTICHSNEDEYAAWLTSKCRIKSCFAKQIAEALKKELRVPKATTQHQQSTMGRQERKARIWKKFQAAGYTL